MLRVPKAQSGFLGALACLLAAAAYGLDEQQTKLFVDPHGGQYVAIFDHDNGMQMTHQCFVEGNPNQGACRGTLVVTQDGQFTQSVFVDGGRLQRRGTYDLDDDQLTFKDELGT